MPTDPYRSLYGPWKLRESYCILAKSRKKLVNIAQKFSRILAKFAKFCQKSAKFSSLDYSACWEPVCNEYETDEVQSVLSARVLDARKENARAYSARGKNFTSLTENRNENYGVGGKTRQRKTKNRKERRESQNGNSARASVKGSLECDSLQPLGKYANIWKHINIVKMLLIKEKHI